MKKQFLFVALFLIVYIFCFIVIKEIIIKMGKKNFLLILSLHCRKKIYSSFPEVSWILSALQNDEWMPCSLLLLKSFLFMPVIQGLCFNCSCEMKTFLLMNKHCHFLNICMQNVFKAIMKCFARVLGSFFFPSPERQFFSTFSFMLSSPIERPFRVNLFKQYQCFSVMNNFL